MKKVLVLATAAIMLSTFAHATIRRVGFFGPLIPNQDFATFTPAYQAAVSGDTIMIFPGVVNVNVTLAKKITLIGPGEFLNPNNTPPGNANMQASTGIATVATIVFAAGSDGSTVTGFSGGSFDVRTSNITIRRNKDITVFLASTQNTYSNLQILENYRVNITNGNNNNSTITNLNISNNLMYAFYTPIGNSYSGNISYNIWAYDNTLSNALDGGGSTMSNANSIELGGGSYLFQNNILCSYASANANNNTNYFYIYNGGNSVFNYNMALETSTPSNFGVGVGNVITPIANAANIFAAFPTLGSSSPDARFKLAAGSPAATVGQGSKPIGMYGGTNPYKPSMIPAVPSIYKLSSAQGNNPSGNSITITLSTRGNN